MTPYGDTDRRCGAAQSGVVVRLRETANRRMAFAAPAAPGENARHKARSTSRAPSSPRADRLPKG